MIFNEFYMDKLRLSLFDNEIKVISVYLITNHFSQKH